ncbi:amino acid ABC transporter ATP-binding/permease protein [Flavobacterium sp. W21_SRS_FM6]|uniref:amino acid ABC transporter ATP-binding/permease protein n=1 Tax=Flavobacterium sp. W21_SRS_FM6 TaxID=3240268 RepID=UPI003F91115A
MSVKARYSLKYWTIRIIGWQPKKLFLGTILALVTALSGIALLMLSGWFISASAITGLAIAVGIMVKLDIYLPGSGIRFFALSRTIGRYAERLYNHNLVLSLIAHLRQQLFAGLVHRSNNDFKHTPSSEWLSKLTADLDSLDNILLNMLIPTVVALSTTVILGLFIALFWPLLAFWLTLCLVFICLMTASFIIKLSSFNSYQTAHLLNVARGQAIEHLQGQLVLQSMGANDLHQRHLLDTIEQFGEIQRRLNHGVQNIQLMHSLLLGMTIVALSLSAFWGVEQGFFDGPIAILLILAAVGIVELLQSVPAQFIQWGKTTYAAERLYLLASPPQQKSNQVQQLAKALLPTKQITSPLHQVHLSVSNHPYIPASVDEPIAFTINSTDKLLIIGKSGRGKSTLGDLISGQADTLNSTTTHCEILVNNIPLHTDNIKSWQQSLGYLSQQNSILADTLYANLTLGQPEVGLAQIHAALDIVELRDWALSLPKQLDTWLGDTGNKLSGGQARRICLARVILKSPQFLLLDEPFNGVDSSMAARIWQNLTPWLQDKCLVLMMHEKPLFWTLSDKQQYPVNILSI